MRWPAERPAPQPGQQRQRYVFAWTPTRVGQHKVWLESFAVKEYVMEIRNGKPVWVEFSRAVLEYYG